jgi:hypothetical protein
MAMRSLLQITTRPLIEVEEDSPDVSAIIDAAPVEPDEKT